MTTAVRTLEWRVHLASPPDQVHAMLATPEGRAKFWAESPVDPESGELEFRFVPGPALRSRVLEDSPPHKFSITSWAGNELVFEMAEDGRGGTDLTLREFSVPKEYADRQEILWVSVLLALKAAVDFGVDLRDHGEGRGWDQGFVDGAVGLP